MRAWFVCPDTDVPSGGVRVIYRHVDHLVAAGIDAAVVHLQPGFRVTWFAHDTPVVCADDVTPDPARDLLVLPEVYGPDLVGIGPGVRKAVFNQNAYNSFVGMAADADPRTPYTHPEVVAAVCVSDDNVAYLRHGFPRLDVRRTVNAVDPELFRPGGSRRRRVAFMPRKNSAQAVQVLKLLAVRGVLQDVEVVALQGLSERQVAEELRRSLLFLSFGYPEGCPCPPKEAMASGCVVVGYHGMGGRDYFTERNGVPVPQGDVVAFARAVERVLARPQAELEAFGLEASARIRARYSPEAERDSVVRVWGELLRGAPEALAA